MIGHTDRQTEITTLYIDFTFILVGRYEFAYGRVTLFQEGGGGLRTYSILDNFSTDLEKRLLNFFILCLFRHLNKPESCTAVIRARELG